MNDSVQQYLDQIKKEGHTTVIFRHEDMGDHCELPIEEFVTLFTLYTVGINGELIRPDGKILHNCFIKRTR